MATTSLLPVTDAQSRLLALVRPVAEEACLLGEALGRWLAHDVAALRTQPAAPLSAMDGYAIRFADLPGPWEVVGESAAGRPLGGSLIAGQAARIFTGAHVPQGADTVMVQEEVGRDGARLTLTGEGPPRLGANIRAAGQDFTRDSVLLHAGDRLTAAKLALVGAGGHATLPVRRRVRVAIAATGDELVAPGSPDRIEQLPETNRLMVAAQLSGLPVEIIDLGILPDRADVLEACFRAVDADLLVTSGGASVGDHDLVRPALEAAGATIDFWRIALRPGKPMMAGRMRDTLVLGLPGNPVSAFVTTLLFVRPVVAALAGAGDPLPRARAVPLGASLPPNGPRTDYMRAVLRDGRAYAGPVQDSGMLGALAASDCLIIRDPHAPAADAAEMAEILDLA